MVGLTNDGTGVADALAAKLRTRGIRVTVGLDGATIASVRTVIVLDGLRPFSDPEQAADINLDAFRAARMVAARMESEGGTFITVQDTGGNFGALGSSRAWIAGPAALARTAAVEWPKATVRAIDIERGDRSPDAIADALIAELLYGAPEPEVGLSASGARIRVTIEAAELEANAGKTDGGAFSFVVASGGGRGVTATCLLELATQHGGRYLLLGRTLLVPEPTVCSGLLNERDLKRALALAARDAGQPADLASIGRQAAAVLAVREIHGTLERLCALGAEAHYTVVDATDAAAVNAAIEERRPHWGSVTAVVHGAGVLADKRIIDKTDDQFRRVYATKVDGLRALLRATEAEPLQLLLLFSSVAARSGNLGQSDYAMANDILNKVAILEQMRRGPNCVVRALGWGPWDGGMVDDGLRARFASMNVSLIAPFAGANAFVRECVSISSNDTELVLTADRDAHGLADPGIEQTFNCTLSIDRQSHRFLDGHRIKGTPVVPLALVLEWFARAARAFRPGLHLAAIRDVKILRGIRLAEFDHGKTQHIVLQARRIANGASLHLGMSLLSLDGARLFGATCVLQGTATAAGPEIELPTDLVPVSQTIYGRAPLFHGPSFHVLKSLATGQSGLLATVGGVHDRGWQPELTQDPWQTDPAMVDAGLQMALLWTHQQLHGNALPTGLEAVHFHHQGPLPVSARAFLRHRQATGARCVADVYFLDGRRQLILELRGVETHVLPGDTTTETAHVPVVV
ncbi:MAG: SDR family oxidoreductase [Deltaproteobacteria bacterium]|nr:SDR family oxidoreductase [Deltaproteobacteria bacterium]